jgi:aminopeptidase N
MTPTEETQVTSHVVRRAALFASLALLLVPARAPMAQAAGRSSSVRTSRRPMPPDLPTPDVVRLTEEGAAAYREAKLEQARARATGTAAAQPTVVEADSLHSYDAIHYRLDVTPSRTSNVISGTMTLDLNVVDPAITTIDLHDQSLNVTATRVNGNARTFTVSGGMLHVPVCQGDCPPHGAGDPLTVAVDYSASTPQTGFYRYARNSYTMAEPYDARYWFPCWDLPFDKATLDVYATVPDTNICVSNGLLIGTSPGPAGKTIYHWQETHPISTYLVAITVGRYWQWNQLSNGVPQIPILECVFPEDSTKAKFDFANVPAMIPAFAARWGPYAFDKYGMVAVTPFGAGGMEHQSMTTINRSWVSGNRANETGVAHELAHQWWGDKVTLVDFRNIWLNEGFASYGECEWREDFYGANAYDQYVLGQMNSALNSDNNVRYALYDPPEANLFGNTIYMKGSVVLHMLRRVLGDASFFAGMQLYGSRFQYGNASTDDFRQAMEDASGQPLDWFINEWVYDKGLPTYVWGFNVGPSVNPGQTTVGVEIRQTQTNAPFFKMPIELRIQRSALPDTVVTIQNDALAVQDFGIDVNGTATNVVFDPRNSIYKRIQQTTVGVPVELPALGPAVSLAIGPNPARQSALCTVRLGRRSSEPIDVVVYDSAGRAVRVLESGGLGEMGAEVRWDLRDRTGRRVPAGLYFVQARVGTSHEERSLIVLE